MNRRDIIKAGAISSILPFLGLKKFGFEDTTKKGSSAYITFHGNLKNDSLVGFSVLAVKDVTKLEAIITNARVNSNFNAQLKYSTTNKFQKRPLSEILDFMRRNGGFEIRIGLLTNPKSEFLGLSPKKFNERRIDKIKAVLPQGHENIYVKAESPYGPSYHFAQSIRSGTGLSYLPVHAKASNGLQVIDVIGGSIVAGIKGSVQNLEKLETIRLVGDAFDISSFKMGTFAGGKVIVSQV